MTHAPGDRGSNPAPARCVIILSDKSSGSSLLQRLIASHPDVHVVSRSPHQENETLYWSKAAAALGLPQPRMMDSRVIPMSKREGERALLEFLRDNTGHDWSGPVDEQLVFRGWTALTEHHGPVFVEKSPHHLHSAAALDLIVRYAEASDLDVRVIGLVRHPIDTLYSMWRRWSVDPDRRQHEWARAYGNLVTLRDRLGDRLLIVRYEDLVQSRSTYDQVMVHCGFVDHDPPRGVRDDSLQTWRQDRCFSFRPRGQVSRVAEALGYGTIEAVRGSIVLWHASRAFRLTWRVAKSQRERLARRAGAGSTSGPARVA